MVTHSQVCRHPMKHSPDLQQLLWLGDFSVNFDMISFFTMRQRLYTGLDQDIAGLVSLVVWISSQGASKSCQPSKVPAACSAAPIISQMFAWVFPRFGLSDDPMGLLVQLVAPEPLDGRASLVRGPTTSAKCIASCNAGGLLPAARPQEFMPLSHYGFGCVGNQQFKRFSAGAVLTAYAVS